VLEGSVDLDSTFARSQPQAPRWDYGIGYRTKRQGQDRICWLEVHPCTASEVHGVVRKHEWLCGWLAAEGSRLRTLPSDFVWVSSGRTCITASSPQARRLSSRGILLAGSQVRIPLR